MSFISSRVKSIIVANGMDITLSQRTTTYNKTTGENTSTYVSNSAKGFVRKYKAEELAGGLILQHDREVKIAVDSLSVVPKEQDLVTVDSKQYQIISVETRNAKGANCMYVIQVRGNAN